MTHGQNLKFKFNFINQKSFTSFFKSEFQTKLQMNGFSFGKRDTFQLEILPSMATLGQFTGP